jgi:hypothetical protein
MTPSNVFWNLHKKSPELGRRVDLLFRKVFANSDFIVVVRAKPPKVNLQMFHELSGSHERLLQIQAFDCTRKFKPVTMSEAISDRVAMREHVLKVFRRKIREDPRLLERGDQILHEPRARWDRSVRQNEFKDVYQVSW